MAIRNFSVKITDSYNNFRIEKFFVTSALS